MNKDRLSDRIRDEQNISRIEAYNRLSEADNIINWRKCVVADAKRRDREGVLRFLKHLFWAVVFCVCLWIGVYWISGGMR